MFDNNAIKTMGVISKRFVEVACEYDGVAVVTKGCQYGVEVSIELFTGLWVRDITIAKKGPLLHIERLGTCLVG